jgi:hypothetical protein
MDILRCIVVINERPIGRLGSWTQLDDPSRLLTEASYQISGDLFRFFPEEASVEPLNGERLTNCFASLLR